jgi:hypothetical protein
MKFADQLEQLKVPPPVPPAEEEPVDLPSLGLNIIQTIEDKAYFGSLFQDQSTWANWKTFLKALFGLAIEPTELEFFWQHTGRKVAPTKPFSEAFCIAGRRAGKSRIAALVAVYLALFRDWTKYLAAGEVGWIFIISSDRNQSRNVLNYVKEFLRLPAFRDLVDKELSSSIRLKNNIEIEVRTASFRSIRGYSILAAILDEVAFFRSEESANPDTEILNALLPGLSTPESLLLAISTPYAKAGVLWQAFKEFYGRDDPDIPLVMKASTKTMNPLFHDSALKRLFQRDRAAARAEYDAEFREDLESYLSLEMLEVVTQANRVMLPPEANVKYFAFTDPSGGKSDSYTLAIAHREGERVVIDRVEEVLSPLDPKTVTKQFADILKEYKILEVTGDRFSSNWCSGTWQENGIRYWDSRWDKSEIYVQFQAIVAMKKVDLLDIDRLRIQFQSLERRVHSGGKDSIDHPPGLHDDLANSCAGVAVLTFQERVWTEKEMEARMPRVIHKSEQGQKAEKFQSLEEEMRDFLRGSKIVRR